MIAGIIRHVKAWVFSRLDRSPLHPPPLPTAPGLLRRKRHHFEPDLVELAATSIGEQKILDRIVGYEKVHSSVVIHYPRPSRLRPKLFRHARQCPLLAHIRACPIAIVVKQPAWLGSVRARNAIVALASLGVSAEQILFIAEIHKLTNEKIEASIAVVIEPDGARRPSRSCYSGLLSDVSERTVSLIMVKDASAVLRDVHVGKAITIIVANRDTHAVAAAFQPGFFGDVGECSSRLFR
jgi:hypothetical protein